MGLYENDNERFNVELFNDKFEYIFQTYKQLATLIHIPKNVAGQEYDGWLNTKPDENPENRTTIDIFMRSSNKNKYKLEKEGYIQAGDELYTGVVRCGTLNIMTDNTIEMPNGKRYRIGRIAQAEYRYENTFIKFDLINSSNGNK